MNKRLILVCSILFATFIGFAANNNEADGPQLSFDKPQHDYGTVYVDEMPETKLAIEFTNTGDSPLILSNVRACCGTRVTKWPREPINPGEKGQIDIEFTLAARPQRISRTVTVTSNNAENATSIFRITGQVVERE